MAFTMNVVSDIGQTFQGAYVKIDEYHCDKANTVYMRIRGYVSRDLANAGANSISGSEDTVSFTADHSDNAKNLKKQGYAHMGTLPKYQNATNVLESGQAP